MEDATVDLRSPASLQRRSAQEVGAWFGEGFLAPLHVERTGGLPSVGIEPTLRRVLDAGVRTLPVSAVYREREGGRRYTFHIPGYTGPMLLSGGPTRATPERLLLPAIPRRLRARFGAAPEHVLVVADIDRCFPVLLATVSGDDALLEAARGDLHQAAGDAMAPDLPAQTRRRLGKRFNNAVVGLVSPQGWHAELAREGLDLLLADARRMHDNWWARFDRARRWRDAWVALHRDAAERRRPLKLCFPDGRRYTFDAATVRGVARRPNWSELRGCDARLAAAIRTTFSAVWRSIEGLVLDEVLHRLYDAAQPDLSLVLPMYDGLVLQVPTSAVSRLLPVVRKAFLGAFEVVGVPGAVTIEVRPTWGTPGPGGGSCS
jgi:hypothetical protein